MSTFAFTAGQAQFLTTTSPTTSPAKAASVSQSPSPHRPQAQKRVHFFDEQSPEHAAVRQGPSHQQQRWGSHQQQQLQQIPRAFPSSQPIETLGAPEEALMWRYSRADARWVRDHIVVRLAAEVFATGGMRVVYKMEQTGRGTCVAKFFDNAKLAAHHMRPTRAMYFEDVRAQATSQTFASRFNSTDPQKCVSFVDAWVVELISRHGSPVCAAEPMLQGCFEKYNDNLGKQFSLRNTPAAFSHFTWENSMRKLLICDIQGVSDTYTDPQIHTADGESYGIGNRGMKGVADFLRSHVCNSICRSFSLPDAGGEGEVPWHCLDHVDDADSHNSRLSTPRRHRPTEEEEWGEEDWGESDFEPLEREPHATLQGVRASLFHDLYEGFGATDSYASTWRVFHV